MPHITVIYSNHRPEVVPLMAEAVRGCDLLIAEDAPSADFDNMLSGATDIQAYLQTTDIEYPAFGRSVCRLWRQLHRSGTRIIAVEPFVETLLQIHEHFANGGAPQDIAPGTLQHRVYLAEKEATAALLDFYQTAAGGHFDPVVRATKRFARLDARRFVLRDQLRAAAIRSRLADHDRICVEAGQIHQALAVYLRQSLPAGTTLKPLYLMRPVVGRLGRRCHLFGPGDLLTLWYIFHPHQDGARHTLLAARALIYNKVIVKEEQVPEKAAYPHTMDEIQTIRIVNRLSLDDCRALFDLTRRASTGQARRLLMGYLKQSGQASSRA